MSTPSSPIAWCLIDDEPVLLDVTADRYLRLSGRVAESWQILAQGGTPSAPDLAALQSRVAIDASKIGAPCRHDLPTRVLEGSPARLSSATLLPMAMSRLMVNHDILCKRGLSALIQRLPPRADRRIRRSRCDLMSLVCCHGWTRRLILPRDACLVRAVSLASHARSRGHDVAIVFGVQLRPFAAHCWVEQDGMLLDDELDHVRCSIRSWCCDGPRAGADRDKPERRTGARRCRGQAHGRC